MKPKTLLIILLVLIGSVMTTPLMAADVLHRLTHNDQYALVLGQVTKVAQSSFTFSVTKVVSGHRVPKRIVIKSAAIEQPQPGEQLLISLVPGNGGFKIHWGLFRVSSLDPKRLKIIKSTWPKGDLAALEHYLHTNGTECDFFFIFSSAFVRYPDGTFTRIYPELVAGQKTKHFKLMICPERQDYRRTDSVTPGIGLYAIYYQKPEDVQFCWETNYGEFNLWEPPDYRVIPLGMTAIVRQWQTVYWTPSSTQEAIPEEGIKVTVKAKSFKSQTIYEETYLKIKSDEGSFVVNR